MSENQKPTLEEIHLKIIRLCVGSVEPLEFKRTLDELTERHLELIEASKAYGGE